MFFVAQTAMEDQLPETQEERDSLPPSTRCQPNTTDDQGERGQEKNRNVFRKVPEMLPSIGEGVIPPRHIHIQGAT